MNNLRTFEFSFESIEHKDDHLNTYRGQFFSLSEAIDNVLPMFPAETWNYIGVVEVFECCCNPIDKIDNKLNMMTEQLKYQLHYAY